MLRFHYCKRPRRGWKCLRNAFHEGPCATMPRWWNVRGWLWVIKWRF